MLCEADKAVLAKLKSCLELMGDKPIEEFCEALKENSQDHSKLMEELKAKCPLQCSAPTNRSTHYNEDSPRYEKTKSKAMNACMELVPEW